MHRAAILNPTPLKAIRRCKEDLDKQILQNRARAEREKEEEETRKEEQRLQMARHVADQAELKEASRKKLLVGTVQIRSTTQ